MRARRLRYTWIGEGPGPRRGSLLYAIAARTSLPTGTVYRVLRVVSVHGDPRRTIYSFVVARVFDEHPRSSRGVFTLAWSAPHTRKRRRL